MDPCAGKSDAPTSWARGGTVTTTPPASESTVQWSPQAPPNATTSSPPTLSMCRQRCHRRRGEGGSQQVMSTIPCTHTYTCIHTRTHPQNTHTCVYICSYVHNTYIHTHQCGARISWICPAFNSFPKTRTAPSTQCSLTLPQKVRCCMWWWSSLEDGKATKSEHKLAHMQVCVWARHSPLHSASPRGRQHAL